MAFIGEVALGYNDDGAGAANVVVAGAVADAGGDDGDSDLAAGMAPGPCFPCGPGPCPCALSLTAGYTCTVVPAG